MEEQPISKPKFSFSHSFIQGEAALGFWAFAKKGVGAVNSFLIISSLSIYQYGVYQLILAAYSFASDFFHGLFASVTGNDLMRYIGEGREDKAKKLFWEYAAFRLIMGLIPAIALFFLAPKLSFRYGPEAVLWAQLLAPLFILDAVIPLGILLLKLRLNFKVFSAQPTIQKIAHLGILAYFFFFAHLGIKEIFIAQILAPVITFVILFGPIIRAWRVWQNTVAFSSRMLWPVIKTYGKWEIPQFCCSDINGRIRPWLIKLFLNTESVGIFGVAYTFVNALKDLLPVRTLGILVPRKIRDKDYYNQLFLYGTKYYTLMSLALVVLGSFGVPLAIYIFFHKYLSSIPLFWLLLPIIIIFALTKMINIMLVAQRRQKFIFYQSILQNGLNLLFLIFTLPAIGLWGLPLAEVSSSLIIAVAKYVYLKYTKFIDPFPFTRLFVWEEQDKVIWQTLKNHLLGFLPKFLRS